MIAGLAIHESKELAPDSLVDDLVDVRQGKGGFRTVFVEIVYSMYILYLLLLAKMSMRRYGQIIYNNLMYVHKSGAIDYDNVQLFSHTYGPQNNVFLR